ncbi:unnamed protein product [Clonostachys rosea]|uniref:Aldehyde dehydrogenase domain-containing protein n=1 Tax=Bionectria ochroleuca TaxID=29856 RepID=A0ABY6V629_BIOOC|nr:unnamed protein product [Clonostachys rosea]
MTTPAIQDDAGHLVVPCIINGKPVIQPSQASFPVVSARTQETIHYGQTSTVEVAVKAVESADATFKVYKKTLVDERRQLLLRAADIFEKRTDEAMHRQMTETSCEVPWARFNVIATVRAVREAAHAARAALTGDLPPSTSGVPLLVQKEPVGPVLMVIPWNGALVLGARGIASALAAGCTVVFKASELCPWTHSFLVETFLEAGFPAGSINLIMSDRTTAAEVTEAVIAHPALRKIEFIGSAPVGRAIGVTAAKHLKPIIMELGDQSPAIVLEDANLSKAATLCATGAQMLHGQVCFGTERVIVQSSIKDKFCSLLADAFRDNPVSGSAISVAFANKAQQVVDDAVKRGAKLVYGDNKLVGASVGPTILTDVDPESIISKQEAFAPTLFVVAVDSDEEAISEANSREGGLSASIFTSNYERGLRIASELEFGQVQLNQSTLNADALGPLAGWKGSGWGSHAGRYGIELFLQHRAIFLFPSEGANPH